MKRLTGIKVWKNCMKKLHEKVTWKRWTKKLHEKIALNSCTKKLHEKVTGKFAGKVTWKIAWINVFRNTYIPIISYRKIHALDILNKVREKKYL